MVCDRSTSSEAPSPMPSPKTRTPSEPDDWVVPSMTMPLVLMPGPDGSTLNIVPFKAEASMAVPMPPWPVPHRWMAAADCEAVGDTVKRALPLTSMPRLPPKPDTAMPSVATSRPPAMRTPVPLGGNSGSPAAEPWMSMNRPVSRAPFSCTAAALRSLPEKMLPPRTAIVPAPASSVAPLDAMLDPPRKIEYLFSTSVDAALVKVPPLGMA